MGFYVMSFPESEQNIKTTRKYAKSKDLSLQKVRSKDLWNIIELQTGRFLLRNGSLETAYNIIDQYKY